MSRTRSNFARSARRGFTLIELLVVLGIILLVLAVAVPSFSALSGSRSVEAGENIAAAAITRARAEAMRRGTTVGALFYPDPDGRTAVAFVALGDALTDRDPYAEYSALVTDPGADYGGFAFTPPDATAAPPMLADKFLALGSDENFPANYGGFAGRPIVVEFGVRSEVPDDTSIRGDPTNANGGVVSLTPVAAAANGAGNMASPLAIKVLGNSARPNSPSGFAPNNTYAAFGADSGASSTALSQELVLLSDVAGDRLPNGVGLQVVTGEALEPENDVDGAVAGSGRTSRQFIDRYTRAGLIAFDRRGRLVQSNFSVSADTSVGRLLGLGAIASGSANSMGGYVPMYGGAFGPVRSGLGIILYRNDLFESAASDGTATDWKGTFFATAAAASTPGAVLDDFDVSEHDLIASFPSIPANIVTTAADLDAAIDNEYAEERWLDANTTPLLVNRFSGTLSDNLGEQAE